MLRSCFEISLVLYGCGGVAFCICSVLFFHLFILGYRLPSFFRWRRVRFFILCPSEGSQADSIFSAFILGYRLPHAGKCWRCNRPFGLHRRKLVGRASLTELSFRIWVTAHPAFGLRKLVGGASTEFYSCMGSKKSSICCSMDSSLSSPLFEGAGLGVEVSRLSKEVRDVIRKLHRWIWCS